MTGYVLNPYLTVNGAKDAIAFYKKAFGATEVESMAAQDGERLMHAEIEINGGKVMLADHFPEFCKTGAVTLPTFENPGAVAIAIHFKTPGEVDALFKRATDAGAKTVQQPEDTFWKARFAVVADPFGHQWMFNAPLA